MAEKKWIDDLNRDPDLDDRSVDEVIRSTKDELRRADEIMGDARPNETAEPAPAQPEKKPFELHIPDVYADLSVDEEPEEEPPAPKKRMGAGWRVLIYVACVMLASLLLGFAAWKCADDICALTKPDREVNVTIGKSDTVADVTKKLESGGLIRYPWLFRTYCWLSHADRKIDPGTYTLNNRYDYHALINGMISTSDNRATVSVVVPEGYDCSQIFELLVKKGVCTETQLDDTAANHDFGYDFLKDIEYGEKNRLEGYLFPDTYEFYVGDDPVNVLDKFLKNFDKKYDEEMRAAVDDLNARLKTKMQAGGFSESEIADGMMDMNKIVIVASLIEKESASTSESTTISSVIYNRLCSKTYPLLEIDATVLYALGEHKATLTAADLMVDSPYNTRKYPGLPIGPISNPGISSLKAALYPEDTSYYFYALDKTGKHHFSETYEEHQKFLDSLENGTETETANAAQ